MSDYIFELRFKKPHKWFFKDDVVYGEIHDGQADRMVCYGWTRKLNKFIAQYRLAYQGWHFNKEKKLIIDGRGYLKIIKKIRIEEGYPIGTKLGIYGGQRRRITSQGASERFFDELLSTGKVEPYTAE